MTGKRRAGRDPVTPPPSTAPADPGMVIAPQVSRRQARLERKRQQRKRIGLAGGAAIGAGILIVGGLVFFGVHEAVKDSGGETKTQSTVLLQLQAPDGTAAASVLLAHDSSTSQGVEVLVPPRVLVDVCGFNERSFGDILSLPGGDVASRQALSTMLGNMTIDGSWVLPEAQFARFLDHLPSRGITADVDVDVVQRTGGGGGRVLVPAGNDRHLSGTQAVEYATYTTSGNADAEAQLARLQHVVDGMAAALPTTETGIAASLRSLGAGGGSSLGANRLASLLAGFAAAEKTTGNLLPTDLPVTLIDAGGAPAYRVDTAGAKRLVSSSFAESLPTGAATPRPTVELLNGVGAPGLVSLACPRLATHHLAYAGSRNAANFNYARSIVEVPTARTDLGYAVAKALGLPASDVRRTAENQTVADVIVILGRDFH
jgi:hypothetical protein